MSDLEKRYLEAVMNGRELSFTTTFYGDDGSSKVLYSGSDIEKSRATKADKAGGVYQWDIWIDGEVVSSKWSDHLMFDPQFLVGNPQKHFEQFQYLSQMVKTTASITQNPGVFSEQIKEAVEQDLDRLEEEFKKTVEGLRNAIIEI